MDSRKLGHRQGPPSLLSYGIGNCTECRGFYDHVTRHCQALLLECFPREQLSITTSGFRWHTHPPGRCRVHHSTLLTWHFPPQRRSAGTNGYALSLHVSRLATVAYRLWLPVNPRLTTDYQQG